MQGDAGRQGKPGRQGIQGSPGRQEIQGETKVRRGYGEYRDIGDV